VRKIVVVMMSTLNNRIANAQGTFWEPFHWGEPEVAYVNQFYRAADTWALSRVLYDVIIPWWNGVASGQLPTDAPEITPAFAEFAQIQHRMTKVVFSNNSSRSKARTSSCPADPPPWGPWPARQDCRRVRDRRATGGHHRRTPDVRPPHQGGCP